MAPLEKNTNGNPQFSVPESQEPVIMSRAYPTPINQFHYIELMPEEVVTLSPLIREYYDENKLSWEPLISNEKFEKLFTYTKNSVVTNPQYNYIGKVFAAYNEEPDYPLEIVGEPIGYIWFYIQPDMMGEPFLFIEHLYVRQSYRQNVGVGINLQKIATDHGKRARVKKVIIDARSKKRQDDWARYGFRVTTARMEFDNSIEVLEQGYFGRVTNLINRKVDYIGNQAGTERQPEG